jgi:hypothetical protein
MFCPNCGKECHQEDNFCAKCGARLNEQSHKQQNEVSTLATDALVHSDKLYVTKQQSQQLRDIFNALGYKHPSNEVSLNYNRYLKSVGVDSIDPETEHVIIHFGIKQSITDGIFAIAFSVVNSKDDTSTYASPGQLVITNKRMVVLEGFGWRQKPIGKVYYFSDFRHVEHAEYQNHTRFTLFGKGEYNIEIEMRFISLQVALGYISQFLGAMTSTQSKNVIEYVERKDSQQTTQNYINTHLLRAQSVKQAFTHLLTVLIEPY